MAAVRKKNIWICSAWQDRKKGNCSHMCEQLRKKGTVVDDAAELASYRDEKYGK